MFEKQQWQAFHMQAASIGINSVERRKLEDSPVELVGFLLKTIQDRAPSPRTPSGATKAAVELWNPFPGIPPEISCVASSAGHSEFEDTRPKARV
jgi:hypothetical protein